jgi:hypothetical protein
MENRIDDILQSMSAAELWQLNADVEPINLNHSAEESLIESRPISEKEMEQIAGLPYDEMYRKHEQTRWDKEDKPLIFTVLGKSVLLNLYLEDNNFEVISAALSPDEKFMFVLLRDLNSKFTYTANAKWHEPTGIYVTMVYHSNFIADWDKCTTTFEEKLSW